MDAMQGPRQRANSGVTAGSSLLKAREGQEQCHATNATIANNVSNTELPSAALGGCHPASCARPKQFLSIVARITVAGTIAPVR
jgi:hypothetical protein